MTTKTKQETAVLNYGFMWVEETTTDKTAAGVTVVTVTKKISRDPAVGFLRRLFKI